MTNHVTPKFVFTGDSITNYWDIQNALNIPASLFKNTGIPGHTTKNLLNRFNKDVLAHQPEHVVLLIGVNDMWPLEHSPYYRGKILSEAVIKSKLLAQYELLIKRCLEINQSLIICSILPTDLDFSSFNTERNQLICDVNEQLKTWCKKHKLIYVDYHQALVSEDGLTMRPGLTVDGLHLNSKGYDIFTTVLRETLEKHHISLT
ncbi:MAG TPA: hypothetical protein DCY20_02795 [Firmicutes bacterium]|nr:hypothetical protein [Bacillota bacterium]